MGKWKPDYTYRTPDGLTVEVRRRRRPGADGGESIIEKVKDQQGRTIRVRHVVQDQEGRIIHEHDMPIKRR